MECHCEALAKLIQKMEDGGFVHEINNPGALLFAHQPQAVPRPDSSGVVWAGFPDPESGFAALVRQVKKDFNRNLTVRQFSVKYSASSEAYEQRIVSHFKVSPNTHLQEFLAVPMVVPQADLSAPVDSVLLAISLGLYWTWRLLRNFLRRRG